MTAEEAKGKWCPHIQFVIGHNDAIWQGVAYTNRGTVLDGTKSCLCIASDCMMWKWVINPDAGTPTNQGYCGLAGRPL
jgi:hypothetical protein